MLKNNDAEVESVAPMPSWMRDVVLDPVGDPVRTSRFIAASEAALRVNPQGRP